MTGVMDGGDDMMTDRKACNYALQNLNCV